MNANELADYLDTFWQAKKFNEAAAMLRKQQAQIEALKAKLQLHEAVDNLFDTTV
jgi:hypothetical protein